MTTTISTAEVDGFAHCQRNDDGILCPGYAQQEVRIRRVEEGVTYTDMGGDIPGIERSWVRLSWVDDEQETCPHCGDPRQLSEQERPKYMNISRMDPDYLLKLQRANASGEDTPVDTAAASEVAAMRAELAELRVEMARARNASSPQQEVVAPGVPAGSDDDTPGRAQPGPSDEPVGARDDDKPPRRRTARSETDAG